MSTPAPPSPTSAAAQAPAKDANRNLVQRVVTALSLLPLVLGAVWMGGAYFAALGVVVGALGAHEAATMAMGRNSLRTVAVAGASAMTLFFLLPEQGERWLHWVWTAVTMLALVWRMFQRAPLDTAARDVSATVFAALYAGLIGYCVGLRELGEAQSWGGSTWVILAFAVTWCGDTGAYFAGRFFGKRKLFPSISPAKTWEGFAGGMLMTVVGALTVAWLLPAPQLTWGHAVVIGIIGGVAGPIGDLVESMLKRACKVKDSGTLLPGHGGMLDRVDALLFNAPAVYLYATAVVLG